MAKPKQSLKLSFKDVDRDIEKYLERYGKPDILDLGDAGFFPVVRGYDNAQQTVFDAYLEQKKYRQLVDYLCDGRSAATIPCSSGSLKRCGGKNSVHS